MKVFLPLVEEIDFSVLGKDWKFTIGDFCVFVKKKEDSEQLVAEVLRKYGKNSDEFLFCVQGLIWWVFNKHWKCSWVADDIFYELYLEVLEKIDAYDKDRGGLLSYIYTIVRGKVTKELYKVNRDSSKLVRLLDVDLALLMDAEKPGCMYAWLDMLWDDFEKAEKYDWKYWVIAVSIARLLGCDEQLMKFLFQKYGCGVLYFFFMLAGKKVEVWDCEQFSRIVEQIMGRLQGKKIKDKQINAIVESVLLELRGNHRRR